MRQPLDRLPVDLLAMSPAEGLMHLSVWLFDCEHHLDMRRPGGLPAAPFTFCAAWITARRAAQALGALDAPWSDPVKPDYQPGDEIVLFTSPPGEVMAQLAHREWFEPMEKAA